jgi:hypothetical protein
MTRVASTCVCVWRGAGGGGQGQEGGAGAQAVGAGLRHLPSGKDHPHQYSRIGCSEHIILHEFWPFIPEVKLKSSKIMYSVGILGVSK